MSVLTAFIKESSFNVRETVKQLEFRGIDNLGLLVYDGFKNNLLMPPESNDIDNIIKSLPRGCRCNLGFLYTNSGLNNINNRVNYYFDKNSQILVFYQGEISNKDEVRSRINIVDEKVSSSKLIAEIINRHRQTSSLIVVLSFISKLLRGSYSVIVYDLNNFENIYALKNRSTLSIGKLSDGYVISSDTKAFINDAKSYLDLQDNNIAIISTDDVTILNNDLQAFDHEFINIDREYLDDSLKGFSHHMLKEIHEQKEVSTRLIDKYINGSSISSDIIDDLKQADKIYILAAGTSYHASLVGKRLLETIANIHVEVITASEFYYQSVYITENPYFILVSQSGETGDLIKCLEIIEQYKILTITNSPLSTLARRANYYLDVFSGPEVAVCSTKAYSAQILLFFIIANNLNGNKLNLEYEFNLLRSAISNFIDKEQIISIARRHITKRNVFYLGRGLDYYVAIEGALKLKEISRIQAEGYPAGEFRHGPIAMIEEDTPVVALISDVNSSSKMRENINELKQKGARIVTIALKHLSEEDDDVILDDVHPLLTPLITVIPFQLIAYYAALLRGLNIDKPKNLTKSVTVE